MQIICHGLKDEDFSVDFIDHQALLGRDDSNSIVVLADGVSRYHAVLVEEDGELYLQDNGSLNGTFLNYNQVCGRQKLANGDIIQIGYQLIKVDFLPGRKVILDFVPPEQTEIISRSALNATLAPLVDGSGHSEDAGPVPGADEPAPSPAPGDDIEHTMVITETTSSSSSSAKGLSPGSNEIGKYVILSRIGKGGLGEVYLAKHKTLGIFRALKVLSKDDSDDHAKYLERFLREAKLASEIRHPNVVGVMDVEVDPACGVPYIVMEYVDGGSLRNSLTANKRLSEEQAVVIVEAVASALQMAEKHRIVHRDIKPDNIMFTKQGEVKLADLGIAKVVGADNDLTKTNMMIGTPAYLPPEQARNAKGVDARADIYSLGATFYEMLTGQQPYPGENPIEVLHKLFLSPVPNPRDVNPEVSAASAAIVMKMMAKDPEERFQSADELLEMMNRTFPQHSAHESAELIQKVIAGECRNSTTFSSGISSPEEFSKKKLGFFGKLARTIKILFILCLIFAGLFFFLDDAYKTVSSFYASLKSRLQAAMTELILPELKKMTESSGYEIQITTVPDSKVYITSPIAKRKMYLSGKDGQITLSEQPPGEYKIEIVRDKYQPLSRNFELERDIILNLPLESVSNGSSASGSGTAKQNTASNANPPSGSGTAKQNTASNSNPASGSGTAKPNTRSDANPLLVTTNLDVVDPDDGVNSLREAIDFAQNQGGDMPVSFAKNFIITLSSPLSIWNSVTIDGGKNKITINGPKEEPMFLVSNSNLSLTLKYLVLLSDCSGGKAGILNISSGSEPYHFEEFLERGNIRDNTPGLVKLVSVKDGGKAQRLWTVSGFCMILNGTSHLHRLSATKGATVRIGPESILENSSISGCTDRKDGDFLVYGTLKNSSALSNGDIYIFNGGTGENLTVKNSGFIENRLGGTINGLNVAFGAVYGYAPNTAANKTPLRGKITLGGITKAPESAQAKIVPSVGKGPDIVFDLTERMEKSSYSFLYRTSLQKYTVQSVDTPQKIIDNMAAFNRAHSYTVKVSENQTPGTYYLADNAAAFNSQVSLEIGNTVYSRALSVGKVFSAKNKVFTLSVLRASTKRQRDILSSSNGDILILMVENR